jgi:hypothetical protein
VSKDVELWINGDDYSADATLISTSAEEGARFAARGYEPQVGDQFVVDYGDGHVVQGAVDSVRWGQGRMAPER